jgi:hypothetical protein
MSIERLQVKVNKEKGEIPSVGDVAPAQEARVFSRINRSPES